MKIELKLAKTEGVHWNCLEGIDPAASLRVIGKLILIFDEEDCRIASIQERRKYS